MENYLYRCVECNGTNVYDIEFRTDYSTARTLQAKNNGTKPIKTDDLPKYLGGFYCDDCQELVSVK